MNRRSFLAAIAGLVPAFLLSRWSRGEPQPLVRREGESDLDWDIRYLPTIGYKYLGMYSVRDGWVRWPVWRGQDCKGFFIVNRHAYPAYFSYVCNGNGGYASQYYDESGKIMKDHYGRADLVFKDTKPEDRLTPALYIWGR